MYFSKSDVVPGSIITSKRRRNHGQEASISTERASELVTSLCWALEYHALILFVKVPL